MILTCANVSADEFVPRSGTPTETQSTETERWQKVVAVRRPFRIAHGPDHGQQRLGPPGIVVGLQLLRVQQRWSRGGAGRRSRRVRDCSRVSAGMLGRRRRRIRFVTGRREQLRLRRIGH